MKNDLINYLKVNNRDAIHELMNVQEVANLFGVSIRTIRRWIKNDELNAIKIGRTLRISKEEINRIKGI